MILDARRPLRRADQADALPPLAPSDEVCSLEKNSHWASPRPPPAAGADQALRCHHRAPATKSAFLQRRTPSGPRHARPTHHTRRRRYRSNTMKVDFWLIPCAPGRGSLRAGCSRSSPSRLDVHWHVMSLSVLNEGRDLSDGLQAPHGAAWGPSRVLVAARQRFGDDVLLPLYTALGNQFHLARTVERQTIQAALEHANLPADLADAMTITDYDEALKASHEDGIERSGWTSARRSSASTARRSSARSSPRCPRGEAAARLWDGVLLVPRRRLLRAQAHPRPSPRLRRDVSLTISRLAPLRVAFDPVLLRRLLDGPRAIRLARTQPTASAAGTPPESPCTPGRCPFVRDRRYTRPPPVRPPRAGSNAAGSRCPRSPDRAGTPKSGQSNITAGHVGVHFGSRYRPKSGVGSPGLRSSQPEASTRVPSGNITRLPCAGRPPHNCAWEGQ